MELPRNHSVGGDHAMGECYRVGGPDRATELSEPDEVFMMELMEDLPPSDLLDGDVDQLSHVMRSLEAEIISGGDAAEAAMAGGESMARLQSEDGGRFDDDDMMSEDLADNGYGGGSFGYWPEVPLMGLEAEGWCVYVDGYEGGLVGYELIDDHQFHCEEGYVEEMYSPLWE
ncbi:hypothetical protein ACP4OV_010018 [Aristida adscensionis]